jgi:hypothetical protein
MPLGINPYTPANWYWIVAGSTTQVYSSAGVAYVSVLDGTYQAWRTAGNLPTNILNAEELFDVLVAQWAPSYLLVGINLVSTGTPALNGTYALDPVSQQQITGVATSLAAGRGLPGGGSTFLYQGHPFSGANFLNFADAAEGYVYGLYQSLGEIVMTGSGSLPSQTVTIA